MHRISKLSFNKTSLKVLKKFSASLGGLNTVISRCMLMLSRNGMILLVKSGKSRMKKHLLSTLRPGSTTKISTGLKTIESAKWSIKLLKRQTTS